MNSRSDFALNCVICIVRGHTEKTIGPQPRNQLSERLAMTLLDDQAYQQAVRVVTKRLLSMGASPDVIKDIAHEVIISLLPQLDHLLTGKDRSAFDAALFVRARWKWIEYLRDNKRIVDFEDENAHGDPMVDQIIHMKKISPDSALELASDPESILISNETAEEHEAERNKIWVQALDHLNKNERIIFNLYYVESMLVKEIAIKLRGDDTKTHTNWVSKIKQRGLKKLRKLFPVEEIRKLMMPPSSRF